jgi:ferredoxin
MIPVIAPDTCTGCGDCVEVCPPQCISLVEEKARIQERFCEECGECVAKCPEGAISLPRERRGT